MSRLVTYNELQQIRTMMDAKHIPVHVWLPIMHLESSGNVYAHNPHGEDSRGLFQINLQAGQGGRYTPDFVKNLDLFDPIVNASAILSEEWLGNPDRIKTMLGLTDPADQAAYMYQYSVRPRFTAELEARIRHYSSAGLNELLSLYGLDAEPDSIPSLDAEPDNIPFLDAWTQRFGRPTPGQISEAIPHPDEGSIPHRIADYFVDEQGRRLQGGRPVRSGGNQPLSLRDRTLLLIIGIPILVIAAILIFLEPGKLTNTIISLVSKIKTGGLIDVTKLGNENEK